MTNFKFYNGNIYAQLSYEEAVAKWAEDEELFVYVWGDILTIPLENDIDFEDEDLYTLLGGEQELTADYQEAVSRNNEIRSFECWLESKIQ